MEESEWEQFFQSNPAPENLETCKQQLEQFCIQQSRESRWHPHNPHEQCPKSDNKSHEGQLHWWHQEAPRCLWSWTLWGWLTTKWDLFLKCKRRKCENWGLWTTSARGQEGRHQLNIFWSRLVEIKNTSYDIAGMGSSVPVSHWQPPTLCSTPSSLIAPLCTSRRCSFLLPASPSWTGALSTSASCEGGQGGGGQAAPDWILFTVIIPLAFKVSTLGWNIISWPSSAFRAATMALAVRRENSSTDEKTVKNLLYLAAAVSDFYIPNGDLPVHKIQSSEGAPSIQVEHSRNIPTRWCVFFSVAVCAQDAGSTGSALERWKRSGLFQAGNRLKDPCWQGSKSFEQIWTQAGHW